VNKKEREAISAIADAVAYIASRCWVEIGTRDVGEIYDRMLKVKINMTKKCISKKRKSK